VSNGIKFRRVFSLPTAESLLLKEGLTKEMPHSYIQNWDSPLSTLTKTRFRVIFETPDL